MCVHFDHLPDMVGTSTAQEISENIGHGDIPDHYLCIDGQKTTQLFNAILSDPQWTFVSSIAQGISLDATRNEEVQ